MTEPPNTEVLRKDIVRGLLKDRTPDEAAIAATALHDFVARFDAIASELERLREFLRRADENSRLIAQAAGMDGTEPDDWRALVAKWDTALAGVRELRADYDAALAAEAELERVKRELDAVDKALAWKGTGEGRVSMVERVRAEREALREAPMPKRESLLRGEAWDERYDEWWHQHASDDALAAIEEKEPKERSSE